MKKITHRWQRKSCLLLMLLAFGGTVPLQAAVTANKVTVKPIAWPITGKVTSSAGEPLPGVTVLVKGTTNGTATDVNGNYSLSVPENGGTLVFSFIGYTTLERTFSGPGTVNVTMADDAKALEEVVVTGYAVQQKKDLTGSVAVVDVEEMTKQPTAQVTSMLQGRAAGVTVLGGGQPGESPQIRIRGINGFGNSSPLYVVDGIPTTNINDINPNDIANLQVLKDAGSASIYGSRAANGVIIISTKRGQDKIKVNYDAYYGTQRVPQGNVWNIATPQEMANLKRLALTNSGATSFSDPQYGNGATYVLPDYLVAGNSYGLQADAPAVDPSKYFVNPNYTGGSSELSSFYRIVQANKEGTDWFHEIFQPAPITSHNVAVSGGGDIGSFYFSGNYFNQEGILMNTYNKRYTIRANSTFNVNKKIRVGENLGYSLTDNPRVTALSEGSGIGMAIRMQPIIPVYDIMGNFAGTFAKGLGNADSPVAIQERIRNNKALNSRLFGNVFAEADILQNFTLRTTFGGEYFANSSTNFNYPEYEGSENSTFNQFNQFSNNGYNWTWSNTLAYHKNFNEIHDFRLLVGTEAYRSAGTNLEGHAQGYFTFDPNFTTLGTSSGTQTTTSGRYDETLSSLFSRLDYTLKDKYLLGATIRRDGSSRFGANNRYGVFPAISAGWRISEESFMQGVGWISDLKLRAGYGVMGNQINVQPANGFTLYGGDRTQTYYPITGTNNTTQLGFRRTRIGNPDAKWESNINGNVGIDATVFGGKLDITVDYYNKQIKDLLWEVELPGTAGAAQVPAVNIAEVQNKGFDGALTGHINLFQDLKLDITGTLTTYKNEILKISNGAQNFELESRRFNGSNIIRNMVGEAISSYYGYKIDGFWDDQAEIDAANAQARAATGNATAVYQNDVKPGRFRYADINGDGSITDADRTVLGSPNPNFTYGLNLAATYRNFDFNMFLYGSQGNEIWNQVKWWTDFYPNFEGAKSKTALYDSWTPENHDATAPIQETTGSFSTTNVPNSYYVENGSYLRAKNAQIGYTLPTNLLSRYGVGRLRVYVQGANLFTITKYSGIDPEIAGGTDFANNARGFGIDEGAYPNSRQYLLGVNVTF